MRLVYLHISSCRYRGIENQNYNLDSGWCYAVDNDHNALMCEKGTPLPNDLWTLGGSNNSIAGRVSSVSAIIGENGAGKTSVAYAIGNLCQLGRPDPVYLFVVEAGGLYYAYTNMSDVPDDSSVKKSMGQGWVGIRSENAGWSPNGLMFDFLYVTPFCANEKLWHKTHPRVFDLSTARYVDDETSEDQRLRGYAQGERNRILAFVKAFSDRYPDKVPDDIIMPVPRTARIFYNYKIILDCRARYIANRRNQQNNSRADSELLDKIGKNMVIQDLNDHWLNFFLGVVSAHLICVFDEPGKSLRQSDFDDIGRLADIGVSVFDCIDSKRTKSFEEIERTQDIGHRLSYGWRNMTRSARNELYAQVIAMVSRTAKARHGKDGFVKWKSLAEFCSMLYDCIASHWDEKSPGIVSLSISSLSDFGLLAQIVQKQTEVKFDLVNVEIQGMSSGEMAYLGMFARLYDASAKMGVAWKKDCPDANGDERRSVVVFLDEAETTMHPTWQCELVRAFVWFVEMFMVKADVQLVFSSHSPLLLSDIPHGNVCFLAPQCPSHKTYGANIYDLYKYAYSLENGVAGAMSRMRLNGLARKVMGIVNREEGAPKITMDDWQIVKFIGDPHIKRYFESLKDLIEASQGKAIK